MALIISVSILVIGSLAVAVLAGRMGKSAPVYFLSSLILTPIITAPFLWITRSRQVSDDAPPTPEPAVEITEVDSERHSRMNASTNVIPPEAAAALLQQANKPNSPRGAPSNADTMVIKPPEND